MVRKIEKIEKEMGYCEIKLEKKRRLRRQVMFLDADLEVLEEFSRSYEGCYRSLSEPVSYTHLTLPTILLV